MLFNPSTQICLFDDIQAAKAELFFENFEIDLIASCNTIAYASTNTLFMGQTQPEVGLIQV